MLSDLQSRIDRDNKAADDDLEWQKLYRQLEGKRVDAGLELVRSVLDTFLKINRFIVVLIAILAAAETALRACGLSVQPIVTEKVVYFVVSGSVIQLGAIALGLGKALEGLLGGARPPRPGRAGEGRPQSAAEAGTQQRTP